ncbi:MULTISPECIES: phenylalanine--tRNA ligase subunit alpha [Bacillales]|jgi:phenylalanyl-tRNA synthetase alpha chain|uniref:phenylalanine--tRNA ligase subunit alpha n=1 Tax=Bacillaceae TaxID=186817 RepID=UPI000BF85CA0|nr:MULTISPECIES: phenylalanine--tRNA ligase subunit alpha [Bacillales]MBT2670657.1 phenylalanine--tRNA ligase subunit alpha [Streptomyces sp. ISL-14]TDL88335.1 phenylalanine--tRNA ligase subunit alpha [Vibrio vulnificus]MBT2648172.1 phenylalanine--tRNA ligase subunit alpha [Bacillus sp. ISL-34]MBT2666196.1 phenylalanine--tRNA ligase subunit alpha [Bacillus sp. ISL-4]MCK1981800.1 phenylalanine--tRNA ligase subunit alpha [Peribacillus sp. Aquil_B1]
MQERLLELQEEALQKVAAASELKELNEVRVAYLGKKGPITEVLRGMGKLSAEERPKIGALANDVREAIATKIEEKQKALETAAVNAKLATETIDVTLPGRPVNKGNLHPLTRVVEEIEDLFIGMGYTVAEGPEVESDYYNFEALNLPKSHPARDMQDSFYITDEILMRTHTSPVQARTMEKHKGQGPVKIICPGKVYRRDNDDATHSHQFQQIEGLVIDENISMSDLKGTLDVFAKKVFGQDREIRLRPSFFPFTEPSVEVDISCKICGGKGCSVCKQTGWIEVLGGGIVHPNVLEMAGFDSKKYSGFAFGIGVERIAMLKYGVDDIRHFYTNDVRFLKQFNHHEA